MGPAAQKGHRVRQIPCVITSLWLKNVVQNRWLTESLNSISIAAPQAPVTSQIPPLLNQRGPAPSATKQHPAKPSPQPSISTKDFAADLPPPNSDAWQPSATTLSPPATGKDDDFALKLPPPDSVAWETLAVPTSARRPPKDRKTRPTTHRAVG